LEGEKNQAQAASFALIRATSRNLDGHSPRNLRLPVTLEQAFDGSRPRKNGLGRHRLTRGRRISTLSLWRARGRGAGRGPKMWGGWCSDPSHPEASSEGAQAPANHRVKAGGRGGPLRKRIWKGGWADTQKLPPPQPRCFAYPRGLVLGGGPPGKNGMFPPLSEAENTSTNGPVFEKTGIDQQSSRLSKSRYIAAPKAENWLEARPRGGGGTQRHKKTPRFVEATWERAPGNQRLGGTGLPDYYWPAAIRRTPRKATTMGRKAFIAAKTGWIVMGTANHPRQGTPEGAASVF